LTAFLPPDNLTISRNPKKPIGFYPIGSYQFCEELNMNKKAWSLSGLSASAVSVLVAFFMISIEKTWWGIGFIVLAIVLAFISSSKN